MLFPNSHTQKAKKVHYDKVDDTTAYVGIAFIGTADSSSGWKIRKLTFNTEGDVTVQTVGTDGFDQIWDNRTGLSYI